MNEQQTALNNLVQAARLARLTFEEHVTVEKSIQILVKLVSPELTVDDKTSTIK